MKTHTPAPWEVKVAPTSDEKFLVCDGRFVIARVNYQLFGIAEHAEANARLIAAAPELLQALQLLAEGAAVAVERGLVNPQVNGGLVLAKAAIAKARGSGLL